MLPLLLVPTHQQAERIPAKQALEQKGTLRLTDDLPGSNLRPPPISSGGVAVVQELHVLLSGATDILRFRRIGRDVIDRVNQMFTFGYPVPVRAIQWEYSQEIPGMHPRGQLAERSREIVGMSHLIAVILGPRLGEVTAAEVRATLEFRERGVPKELMIFRWADHDQSFEELESGVINDFQEEPDWTRFSSPVDFQGLLFTSLIPHMLRVATPSYRVTGAVSA